MASIINEMSDLVERWSLPTVKAAIALQYDFGDGVDEAEVIAEEAEPREVEQATDDLLAMLEPFNEQLGYEKVESWLEKYMLYLGAKRPKVSVAKAPTPAVQVVQTATVPPQRSVAATSNVAAKTSKPAPAPAAQTVAPKPAAAPAPTAPATPAPVQTPAAAAPSGNYANFVADDWEAAFTDWSDFQSALDDIAATEHVYTHDEDMQASGIGVDPVQANLKIVSIMDSPIQAAQFAAKMKSDPDVVLSSMKGHGGTGLALELDGGRIVPIGQSAIDGVCARAGFTREGFDRHMNASEEDAARELNGQFNHGKGGVTVIENCGKVRAMNSDRFAYGKIADIARVFESFWKKKYPNATVQQMYVSHTLAYWEMNLSAYKSDIFKSFNSLLQSGYDPVLQFATSNTANSAFRIMPGLSMPGSGVVIPLCNNEHGIRVRHSGSGNYTDRVNGLMQSIIDCYSSCEAMLNNANANLEKLKAMKVNNATNALLRELDDIGFPRKQGREAAENFRAFYGTNQATGFDCFIAVANAYSFFVRDNPGNMKLQFDAALRVGRAAAANWDVLGDIPGEYKGY